MVVAFVVGFLFGLVALAAAEAAALLWAIASLRRRNPSAEVPPAAAAELGGDAPYPSEKQGFLWVLEPEKIPKVSSDRLATGTTKEMKNKKNVVDTTKEMKNKKNAVEVFPVKKLAKIKGQSLSLSSPDGSQTTIELLNCTVVAVSASSLPSRKWAKRYPIKLESKESEIYNGSKVCYLYVDTSWEKESWCKALRLASTSDREKRNWHAKLSEEFRNYISSLNAEYPCFLKPSALSGEDHEVTDKTIKTDGSSKVRLFLKRLAKKASTKAPLDGKASSGSSTQGERKMVDKVHISHGASLFDSHASSQEDKSSSSSSQELGQPSAPISALGNNGQASALPEANIEEKFADEGTLCWNLLSSRLFFDAKMNDEINKAIKARIQRTLANMRAPPYIGDIMLTEFSLGKLPPYVHRMRVLPLDLNELWAFEVDFEYSSGILLHIETRLEVQEPELQKDIMKTSFGGDPNGEVNSDLLESIEQYGNQFNSPQHSASTSEDKEEADVLRHSKSTGWTSTYISRWKNILHSIADHVSQVPLSLSIKILSVRGTLRIHLKPPPSDQLWYGFTSMPELDWDLESSVGDRKITNSHIASLLGNRFKTSLRESLVLPNCESISMSWMLAEKDDWVPRKDAPFIWLHPESTETRVHATSTSATIPEEAVSKVDTSNGRKSGSPASSTRSDEPIKNIICIHEENQEHAASEDSSSQLSVASIVEPSRSAANDDLRLPLLSTDKLQEDSVESRGASPMHSLSRSMLPAEEQSSASLEDAKRKTGRRTRIMDFGKRMGDKLEEKRRHIEEKGRHIVEKMRENTRTNSMERIS